MTSSTLMNPERTLSGFGNGFADETLIHVPNDYSAKQADIGFP